MIILLNLFASFEALAVEGVEENIASVFSVNESQSARLKFVNVLLWRGGGDPSGSMSMVIGRWSEFSFMWVFQDEFTARCAEMIEMSGELGFPCEGSLVGWWSLIVIRLLLLMLSFSTAPRCCALSHVVEEYQAS